MTTVAGGFSEPNQMPASRFFDRRIVLTSILTSVVALFFWTQSRYPALSDKAEMGGSTVVQGIAFDEIVELLPSDGIWWELAANTLNWMYTNWKGMTFGILFAACALTLFSLIERRSFANRWANAALGAAIGTPLGVCVNCAAPIARGFHSAGMRLETTLAALIASPTLNVIVVSMTFALLPFHLAALKLAGALAFILVGVPLLTRFVFAKEAAQTGDFIQQAVKLDEDRSWLARRMERIRPPAVSAHDVDTWPKAIRWLVATYGRNLVFIGLITVPLMILAGFLGALAITFLPFSELGELVDIPSGLWGSLALMTVIALVCIFLPVPIAFDVIMAVILVNSGWPAKYVMPLLFALGCYSVYSFLIVGRAISFRVSGIMAASLTLVAVATGIVAHFTDPQIRSDSAATELRLLSKASLEPGLPTFYERERVDPSAALAWVNPVKFSEASNGLAHEGRGSVSALIAPLAARSSSPSPDKFAFLQGPEIGLNLEPQINGLEAIEPFAQQWAAASGDIDGDGWTDVAIGRNAARGGVEFFRNIGGTFAQVPMDLGPLDTEFVGSIAFVDLNQDGSPDLFASAYLYGTYILWNRNGRFDWEDRHHLPNGKAGMVGAPGFADLDGDGDIDILAANWSLGTTGNTHEPFLLASQDRIFWNEGNGAFAARELEGIPGESLTSLIADIDRDGRPDILIGDDVSTADKVYLNRGNRRFVPLTKADGIIPYLTNSTMSFDMGDVDGDLSEELYSAQIAWPIQKPQWDAAVSWCEHPAALEGSAADCFERIRNRAIGVRQAHPSYSKCDDVRDPTYRAICATRSTILRAGFLSDPSHCEHAARLSPMLGRICEMAASPRYKDGWKEIERQDYVGGVRARNLLLTRGSAKAFTDIGEASGTAKPGWSWNARFVDLDQDSRLDLLVGTGHLYHRSFFANRFYRNKGNGRFDEAQDAFGLADPFPTSSFLLLDYDRDGDVDIIRPSLVSQPIVHRNDNPSGKAIWVRLEDELGNRAGIGTRIIVTLNDGRRMLREIRLSGGYASADRPQAHFGIGDTGTITGIEVIWPDRGSTKLSGPIDPNSEIVFRRSG